MMQARFIRAVSVAALCAAAALPAAAQTCQGSISAQEASSAEDARYAAQTTGDFAAMDRLFGDDLVYIHSSAVVDDKASYIESMRSGNVKYRVMRRSDVKVRTYGCVAIITGNADFDVTVKGQDMSVQLRFHSIWAKRPAGAQFISWQATRVPPKQ
jgi:ketosteroid isomerase-like protein